MQKLNLYLCADHFETSTPPRAFELLKIDLFKFPPPCAKIAFKYPTLVLDLTVNRAVARIERRTRQPNLALEALLN